jgi:hypothetical protein
MSGFKLLRHEILRDPTKEELYNGPKREKLPLSVQKMEEADTACTFCGVSYFVFAEVQELQQKVKSYHRHFETFMEWTRREKATNESLRSQMVTLERDYAVAFASVQEKLGGVVKIHQDQQGQTAWWRTRAQMLEESQERWKVEKEAFQDAQKSLEARHKLAQQDMLRACDDKISAALAQASAREHAVEEQWKREKTQWLAQLDAMQASHFQSLREAREEEERRWAGVALQKEEAFRTTFLTVEARTQELMEDNARLRARLHEMEGKEITFVAALEASKTQVLELREKMNAVMSEKEGLAHEHHQNAIQMSEQHQRLQTSWQDEVLKWKNRVQALEEHNARLVAAQTDMKTAMAVENEKAKVAASGLSILQRSLEDQSRLLERQSIDHKAAMESMKAEWAREAAQWKTVKEEAV